MKFAMVKRIIVCIKVLNFTAIVAVIRI